jgi:hypothetical protein
MSAAMVSPEKKNGSVTERVKRGKKSHCRSL